MTSKRSAGKQGSKPSSSLEANQLHLTQARWNALQVPSTLMRTHFAIVNVQDEAYVGKLIEELEESRNTLETEAEKSTKQANNLLRHSV
jgi:hypothetical protein